MRPGRKKGTHSYLLAVNTLCSTPVAIRFSLCCISIDIEKHMSNTIINIRNARKLLGKTSESFSDDQLIKMLKMLESLADYALDFNTKHLDVHKK